MDIKVTTLLFLAASFCDVTSGDALADPGLLRVPRIYNALITTNKKLEPSRAYPHAAPVVPVVPLPPGAALPPPPETPVTNDKPESKDGVKQYPLTFHPRSLGYYQQPYYPYPYHPYVPNPYYYNQGAGPHYPVQYPYQYPVAPAPVPYPVLPVVPSSYKASQSSNVEMHTGIQDAASPEVAGDDSDYQDQYQESGGSSQQSTEQTSEDN